MRFEISVSSFRSWVDLGFFKGGGVGVCVGVGMGTWAGCSWVGSLIYNECIITMSVRGVVDSYEASHNPFKDCVLFVK